MIVSPTEPGDVVELVARETGLDFASTALAEYYGADYLLPSTTGGLIGLQRKTVSDLSASVLDGRLAREVARLCDLDCAALGIDGDLDAADGLRHSLPAASLRRAVWEVQRAGIIVANVRGPWEFAKFAADLFDFASRPRHLVLRRRPTPPGLAGTWGEPVKPESWLLQGLPGVGPELAERILEAFGTLPLRWACTEAELRKVRGVGKARAAQLYAFLGGDSHDA